MEATVNTTTILLTNLLIGSFCVLCLCGLVNVIQCFVYDLRREKREREQAQRDLEYHEQRMKELQ